jgi:Protein of unknown function (DUF3047)
MRRSASGLWILIFGVLVLAAGVGILLASPRQRALYFGEPPASAAPPPAAVVAAVGGGPAVSSLDAAGRLRVRIADREPSRLPAEGVPPGWAVKEFTGRAAVEVVRADGRLAARLRSERTSFALHRDVVVELRELPYLSWSWKVAKLPAGGDVREAARDDQAAQVYVIFPRWPSPRTSSDVIGYVWDSRAPVGTRLKHPRAGNVGIVVVESGPERLNEWRTYERNVAADYAALFGRQPSRVGKVAVMVDTNDTRGEADVLFGDLIFSRTPQGRTEIPTTVLR